MASTALFRHWHTARIAHRCFQQQPATSSSFCPSTRRYKSGLYPPNRRPRNDEITHPLVQLVDQETGALKPPAALSDILASVDRKTHFLELVKERPNPIVKIIDKKSIYEARKQQMRSKKTAISTKEIQLTWCMGVADRVHKLRKVREELVKGNRVQLVFAPKRNRHVSSVEMERLLQDVVGQMQDVMREWKPREVKGTLVILHLQGTPSPG